MHNFLMSFYISQLNNKGRRCKWSDQGVDIFNQWIWQSLTQHFENKKIQKHKQIQKYTKTQNINTYKNTTKIHTISGSANFSHNAI